MNTLQLWWFLTRRSSSASRTSKDPARFTVALTVAAFASVCALLLIVIGGVGGFSARAQVPNASSNAESYVVFAYIASALLCVPLVTMGGSAARLVVARRDDRLARLRLVGATTGQITVLSLLDAMTQAFVGTVLGVIGYVALIPVVGLVPFEGRGFSFAELWVPPLVIVLTCVGIVAVGVVSALVGLQRVVVSPLGVTQRQSTPALKFVRFLALGVALVAIVLATQTPLASIAFIVVALMLGLFALNVVGPLVLSLVGHLAVSVARTAPTLLAARRIIDDPKTAWRSVGSVALATFIAGLAAIMALFANSSASDPAEAQFLTDLSSGAYLTLAIAGVLAAISTGISQAGRVIAQREQYHFLHLAGAQVEVLESARMRETVIPMAAAVGTSLAFSALFLVPVLGTGFLQQPAILLRYVLTVAFAVGIVLLGAMCSRGLVRSVTSAA